MYIEIKTIINSYDPFFYIFNDFTNEKQNHWNIQAYILTFIF